MPFFVPSFSEHHLYHTFQPVLFRDLSCVMRHPLGTDESQGDLV
jgi:hypothetical protein